MHPPDENRDSAGRTFSQVVADEVMAAIAARGMSMREVARQSGIPLTSLHERLHDEYHFNTEELARIAAALGVSPSSLVPDD